MFKALLDAPMREGKEGMVDIQDVRAPVFRTLLYFLYTDSLPEVRTPCCTSPSRVVLLPPKPPLGRNAACQ